MLDEPLFLAGTFYVGWEKYETDGLNIGMDANNNRQEKIFYELMGEWYNTTIPGALMIRPMVGPNMVLSTNENNANSRVQNITVFPNPATTYFSISNRQILDDSQAELKIYSMCYIKQTP